MIALVVAALAARRTQALLLMALAALTTAAAAAAPAFLTLADRSVAAAEIRAASPVQRSAQIETTAAATGTEPDGFLDFARDALRIPGFARAVGAETDVIATGPAGVGAPRLAYREDACAHLRVLDGRCASATGEVMLTRESAGKLAVRVGSVFTVEYAVSHGLDGYVAAGPPVGVSVVGIVRPRDAAEPYWGTAPYFGYDTGVRGFTDPILTDRSTLRALDHQQERLSVTAVIDLAAAATADPNRLVDRIDAASQAASKRESLATGEARTLLAQIAADRAATRQVVPALAVPLVVLGWFGIYLAVAYGTLARRREVGLLRLRGTGFAWRWWLAAGEALLPLLCGALVGVVAGRLLVAALAPVLAPDAGTADAGPVGWRYPLLALVGALACVPLAQRQSMVTSVSAVLRRVPPRTRRWSGGVLDAVVVVLAVAALFQLRSAAGAPAGLALLVPGLLVAAVAVLAGRLVLPLAVRLGRWALRRGRLPMGLAALRASRTPGMARLLVLMAVAGGLAAFTLSTAEVAARSRAQEAQLQVGAARVADVAPVTRTGLLTAVHRVDPEGRWAMAVSSLATQGGPPALAVDTGRLARVANWPGPLPAAAVAARLRPPLPAPLVVRGHVLSIDIETSMRTRGSAPELEASVAPLAGGSPQAVRWGALRAGRHTYRAEVQGCAAGCRLVGMEIKHPGGEALTLRVVLRELRQDAAPAVAVAPDRWRLRVPAPKEGYPRATLSQQPDGERVDLDSRDGFVDGRMLPADLPYPLPVFGASVPGGLLVGVSNDPLPVRSVGTARVLPRLGAGGILLDMAYADALAPGEGLGDQAQVWLGTGAPHDALDRLRAAGLALGEPRDVDGQRRYLDGQGPATALRFHLFAATLALLIALVTVALVVSVDVRLGGDDLRALAIQGVPARVLRRAARGGYLALAGLGVLLGALAGLLAFRVAVPYLPMIVGMPMLLDVPPWPGPRALAGYLVVAAVLVGAGALAGRRLGAAVRTGRASRAPAAAPAPAEPVAAGREVAR